MEWLRAASNDCINYPKYGNGNVEVDEMTKSLCDFIADQINNYPNGRGGVFDLVCFH
jgi:pyruvate-formate lyase